MKNYIFIHQDTSIDTVNKFLQDPLSIAKNYHDNLSGFLSITDEAGISNRIRIHSKYSESDLEIYPNPESITGESPFYVGTIIIIPKDQSFNELLPVVGKDVFLEQQDIKAFLSERFKAINDDPDYVKGEEIEFLGNKYSIKLMTQMAQVWIWVRSINRIVNVTKFIRSAETNVSADGGSFSLNLQPVEDIDTNYLEFGNELIYFGQALADGKYREPYFSKHIQQNDIVFIRFEKLNNEEQRGNLESKLFVEKSNLPNQIYDMIGLVDSCGSSYNSVINDTTVSVSGRDFTKLLVEDGAYFLPFALMEGSDQFFVNEGQGSKFFKRLFVTGNYYGLFFKSLRSIRDTLGFIFNQLTNTSVLPDTRYAVETNLEGEGFESSEQKFVGVNLFSEYPEEKIAETYILTDANNEYLNSVEKNGVWRIIHLLVDNSLDDRRVSNDGIIRPDGTIMEQIRKTCQPPFVEFWGDTYGDTYTFIARQPPLTGNQIKDYIKNNSIIEVGGGQVTSVSLNWEEEYYSWYEIQPQNAFIGKSNFLAAAYIPIVYFREYVETFGNHRISVPCNYVSYDAISGDESDVNNNLFRRAVVEDLIYVISSNAYLPFTRKGQIVIKGGDRRIKRGTFIRFKPTGELFYVNEVSNSLRVSANEIDRETVITVSRGMVEEYINDPINNYFNIINIDTIRDSILFNLGGQEQEIQNNRSNILVNKEVFNFFLNRRQFDE